MNLVVIEHLTKSYTERLLFDDTSFSINEGEKIRLIDVNDTGRSTLLRIVTGLEDADSGSVVRGHSLYIRYLSQIPEFVEGDTMFKNVARENAGETHYSSADEMRATAKSMLNKLGIIEHDALTSTLSGGQRKRVALASMLMSTTDLLILDEPINRLDSGMADWLKGYLKAFRDAPLMITHGQYLLDSVVGRIVELDKGELYSYQASYEGLLTLKTERMEMTEASEHRRQTILRNEVAWTQRGAKARSTKQKAHIQQFEELRDQKGPEYDRSVELESITNRLNRTTVGVEGLCKAYGDKVLMKDFTYIFLEDDRVDIIDPNRSGKSTLIEMLAGWVEPDSDTIQMGQTVKMEYLSQEDEAMDESLKIIDYVKNVAEYVRTKDSGINASQMLERFLFPSGMQYTSIGHLSDGERRRLYLLRILMKTPNAVLLDKPTNDLDVQTLAILEDYLDTFPGVVIAVSHDRYFLDRVVNRAFAFEGQGKVTQYEGEFTDYQITWSARHPQETGEQKGVRAGDSNENGSGLPVNRNNWKQAAGGGRKRKLSFKEQRKWEIIEADIMALERSIGDLEQEIGKSAANYTRLSELVEEKSAREAQLEKKMERWIYLNELAEQIEAQK